MIVNANRSGWVHIGRLGENQHVTVRFGDLGAIYDEYPDATVTVLHQRPGDQSAYPVAPGYVTVSGGVVDWQIQSGDLTAVGRGRAELVFTSGGVIAKTIIYTTEISDALDGAGDPPEPWESWVQDVAESADEAKKWAIEEDSHGNPVPPTDTTHYHNSAKYHSQQAAGSAQAAQTAAGHYPYVGSNGKWWVWDVQSGAFVDTNVEAQGPQGDPGTVPDFSIGTVTTGAAGSDAAASITGTTANPVLNLTIPQGIQGVPGQDADVSELAPVIVNSTTAADVASVPDGADDRDMQHVVVGIEPVQDLHGYDNPWPAGGNKNLVNVSADNVVNYATSGYNNYTISGNTVQITGSALFGFKVPCSPSTEYTVSYTSSEQYTGLRVLEYTSEPDAIRNTDNFIVNQNVTSATFTTSATAAWLVVGFYATTQRTITKIQCETGSTATSYAPYSNICSITGWTGCNVSRTGKNLIQLTASGRTHENVTYTVNSDLSVSLTGTATATSWLRGTTSDSEKRFIKAGTYHLSGGISSAIRLYIVGSFIDGTEVKNSTVQEGVYDTGNGLTFTLLKDAYINYQIQINSGTATGITIYPMISKVSSDYTYEPYHGNTYNISWQTEAGTVYGGTLDAVTGVLTVDRARITLYSDDIVSHVIESNNARIGVTTGKIAEFAAYKSGVCNKAVIETSWSGVATNQKAIGINNPQGNQFVMNKALASSLQETKDLCGNDGLQIVTELSTPVTYQLTPVEIATLLGQNNVWADTGKTALTYPADTKLYIDNKITQAIAAALNA